MKTHKKCKGCGISKPIYRFNDSGVCFTCRQKAEWGKLEKELLKQTPPNAKKTAVTANPLCLLCKQPIQASQKDGAYHKKCRKTKSKVGGV